MAVLINPSTKEAAAFSPEESAKKAAEGWLVPLVSDEGRREAFPVEEAKDYLATRGYRNLEDSELQSVVEKTHYNSPGQTALAGFEGAMRGVSGPIYDHVAPKYGLTTTHDILSRKKAHPDLAHASEFGSTVAAVASGEGILGRLPGVISKAGEGASLLGKFVPGVAGQVTREAIKGATEGAIYTALDKLDDKILGDPDAVGESLLAHVGMGALLGGGGALALTPVTKAINKAGNLTQKLADKLSTDHVAGKALNHLADIAIDVLPLGVARPPVRIAKKALFDSFLQKFPEKAGTIGQLMHIGDLTEKFTGKMENYAAGIFAKEAEKNFSFKKEDKEEKEPELDKLGTMVMDHASDPLKLIEKMNGNTMVMADTAPEVSAALTRNMTNAVAFLNSKLPKPQKEGLLDSEPKIPTAEIQAFNRYAEVVKDPLGVLTKVKDSTLMPQDLETLSAVYPVLLGQMKNKVMDKLILTMGKSGTAKMPYGKRMSVSLFLGVPLDRTLKGQSILANQSSFSSMQLQKQMNNQIQRGSKSGLQRMDPMRDLTRSQRAISRR